LRRGIAKPDAERALTKFFGQPGLLAAAAQRSEGAARSLAHRTKQQGAMMEHVATEGLKRPQQDRDEDDEEDKAAGLLDDLVATATTRLAGMRALSKDKQL
jgi:phosphoribosylpyrophosphate synthetase